MKLPENHYKEFLANALKLNIHPELQFEKVFPDNEEYKDTI